MAWIQIGRPPAAPEPDGPDGPRAFLQLHQGAWIRLKLLGAKGIATRNKKLVVSPGLTTRSKKLLETSTSHMFRSRALDSCRDQVGLVRLTGAPSRRHPPFGTGTPDL